MFNVTAYRAHEVLVAPARGTAQLWRLVFGIVLIFGVTLLAGRFLNQFFITLLGYSGFAALIGENGQTSQLSVIYLLSTFGLLIFGVVAALKVVHRRDFLQVLGEGTLFRQQFISVFAMLLILNFAILVLPPWNSGEILKPNVPLSSWLLVLPFGLLAVLIQVSAEEILFRGYLQQQLAARFRSPLIWMIIPCLVFGWGHYAPTAAGENAFLYVVWACLFGLVMADLTARSGTLAPAIAVHFVNNAFAILFVSMPDGLSGLSLYATNFDMSDSAKVRDLLPVEFMMILISWLGARLAIRR